MKRLKQKLDVCKAVAFVTFKEWGAYRTHSMVSIFVGPVYFIVQYFIWTAVYGGGGTLNGIEYAQMIRYFGATALIGYLVMDFADWNLSMLIRMGKFLTFALRPLDHRLFAFSQKIRHRILGFITEFVPCVLIFTLLFGIDMRPAYTLWLILSLMLAFFVCEIGAVFGQRSQLIWDIPPVDSFNMNRAIYGIPLAEYITRLDELAAMFEIQEVIHKPTRVLSLGERMKCEFIMAMLHKPKIVFLDEPTIGLDVIAKAKIREFIQKANAKGTTFILTTHDLEDVKQLADHVIIINHGAKVFDDTLQKLQLSLGEKKIVELTLDEPFDSALIGDASAITTA